MSPVELAIAFAAGLISVTSPRCLPLLPLPPGYLGYLSGLQVGELQANRRRTLGAAALFLTVSGLVLVAMGVLLVTDRWLLLVSPVLACYAQARWPPI